MTFVSSFRSTAVLALALFACGGRDGGPPADAGVDAREPAPTGVDIPWVTAGEPPLTPTPPRECPTGFRQVCADTGVCVCDPWPETGALDCTGVEAHFPGEPACARVGTACPAGTWPEGLPSDRHIVYVRAGAGGSGSGLGTMTNPYSDVGFAVSRAEPGSIVAVARGTYDGRVDLLDDVSVWGTCPEETILTSSEAGEMSTVVGAFFPGTSELRNLTVRADAAMGIYVEGGASVSIRDVVIDRAWGFGIYASDAGTSVDVENVIVENVIAFPSGPSSTGIGIQYIDGAGGMVRHTALENNVVGHMVVAFDSVVTLDRVVGRRSPGQPDGIRTGTALAVQQDADVTVRESAFDANESGGLLATLGSRVTATDVSFRDSGPEHRYISASAIEARVGSEVHVTGALIERPSGAALIVAEDGSLTVEDAIVRDVLTSGTDSSGLLATVEGTGHLSLSRVLAERLRRGGVVTHDGTSFDAADLVVRDVMPTLPRNLGTGMVLGGAAHVERAVVDRATLMGIAASGATSEVELVDVAIRDTASEPEGGFYGRGLECNLGAHLTGDRVLVERSHEVALFSTDPGSTIELTNFIIRDTMGEACGDACGEDPLGYGVSVYDGGSITLEGFQIARSRVLGVQVGEGGTFHGTRGEIASCDVGIAIQNDTFDLATDVADVSFRDVRRNFDTLSLPLPDTGLLDP